MRSLLVFGPMLFFFGCGLSTPTSTNSKRKVRIDTYYSNGAIQSSRTEIHGVLRGNQLRYYPSGVVQSRMRFRKSGRSNVREYNAVGTKIVHYSLTADGDFCGRYLEKANDGSVIAKGCYRLLPCYYDANRDSVLDPDDYPTNNLHYNRTGIWLERDSISGSTLRVRYADYVLTFDEIVSSGVVPADTMTVDRMEYNYVPRIPDPRSRENDR